MSKEVQLTDEHNEEENEQGASMVEYALLVALIAVVAIAAVTLLGNQVSTTFSNISSSLAGAAGGS